MYPLQFLSIHVQNPVTFDSIPQLAGSMESDPFVIDTADLEDEGVTSSVFPVLLNHMPAFISPVSSDLGDELYSGTLKAHTCYDLIPTSTKIVVLDTNLKVNLCLPLAPPLPGPFAPPLTGPFAPPFPGPFAPPLPGSFTPPLSYCVSHGPFPSPTIVYISFLWYR